MIAIELISVQNVADFRAIRLRSLGESPTAFGSTYAEESQLSDAQWLARAARCGGEGRIGYLAMDGPSACGIVRATLDDQDPTIAWLESMWVDPPYRKTGVGRMLVDEILVWARRRGTGGLKLTVTSNNEPAIRFYRSCGFLPTGRTEPYPNDAALREIEMWRPMS